APRPPRRCGAPPRWPRGCPRRRSRGRPTGAGPARRARPAAERGSAASAAAEEREEQRQDDGDDQAGGEREVERPAPALDVDVSRQSSEPWHLSREVSRDEQDQSQEYHQEAE